MRNLMPIGRFSEICRLSIPALRHYNELGLLAPAAIDPDTGYRYYSMAQTADADRIRTLRFLDMPLPEIKAILEGDPERTRQLLAGHRDRLLQQTERQQYAIRILESMLREEPPMTYEIHMREVVPQQAASIRAQIPWAEIGPFVGGAMGEIFQTIATQGGRVTGPPMAIYHCADAEQPELDVEVAVPLAGTVKSAGRVGATTVLGGLVATTLHVGSYETVGQAYQALGAWVQEHSHETAGPPREVYLTDPNETEPSANRTEILWPIK